MHARIAAIEYYLPAQVLDNEQLAKEFPDWGSAKIEEKTGIVSRHIAAPDECSSDLGVAAAQRLFHSGACLPSDIDFLLLCTQTPDHILPTTACLMQERLNLPTSCGALDFNLGCSGYIYGLSLAKGLIETGQANNVLLVMAETYSKLMGSRDRSVRTLFGDGAAATLVAAVDSSEVPCIGPFSFGTDGKGGKNLIVPSGGYRQPRSQETGTERVDSNENWRSDDQLFMNGPEIFTFTLKIVARCVNDVLAKAGLDLGDIDLVVFHQANQYMLEHLRKKLKIPEEKFVIAMRETGNTVSATIPLALKAAETDGRLKSGHRVLLVGFGVGYSWGGTLIRWGA